ncbi:MULTISPECIES: DEAD/DEAH box helicase [unclassified Archaeoglobus]|mgnify:CR=1 FL=1|uniref:DEAD/DEAH box helicase n=1 Tax=unclassified Archaeoglobus TaxID=2643606 RepID=UPI0025C22B2A|nr:MULTISPECIES: DEAD/DEAH box helicase [unclassified Archaeoglobus]
MVEELFCSQCGRLKTRCICRKETIRQKNLEMLRKVGYRKMLEPIFNCEDEIVMYRIFSPFREYPTKPLDFLPHKLSEVLKSREITKLYEFQKKAIELLMKGKNVVITAPTGFGKTEAFAIPLIEKVLRGGKGIIFYPTKALARDQELKIKEYSASVGLKAVRFDGDSDSTSRKLVLGGKADIILTNPDMVDYHLRYTPAFRHFCRDVVFVAVDELHTYTGVLGSNMHYLMKRLSRFADFQVACASATLSNAKEFAEELFDREFIHVSGEHRKATLYLIARYTPSMYSTIRDIVMALRNRKIIVFGNSYRSVETINLVLRRSGIKSAIHKSGLPKDVRRGVEERFRNGEINVVVATPTLELGIDVGDVDVVISELVPYSQMQQRMGRAGRKGQESVGIIVLREEDSISTYYKNNPEEYFRDEASGYVERKNEEIMKYQILSMCIERPLKDDEAEEYIQTLNELESRGLVIKRGGMYLPTALGLEFAKSFSMRGIGDSVKMYCDGKLIGERTLPIAVKELFPGSIIIHNGVRYRSQELDLRKLRAELVSIGDGNEITDPLYTTIPRVVDVEAEIFEPVNACYCTLEITIILHGYIERNVFEKERKSIRHLDEPVSYTFRTKGVIFSAPFPNPEDYEDYYAGSFHALEHVLIETTDAITGGGSREMGGISVPEGDIFIYDATAGGSGLSKLLFKRLNRAFKIAQSILKGCECNRVDGCPRCTYSYQCGNNNQPLNRIGALNIAEKVLRGEIRRTDWKKYSEVAEFRYFP